MKSFQYRNALSIRETCRLLQEYGDRARINAGGTDLLGMLKDGIFPQYPDLIVNIKGIPALDRIREVRGGMKIGALAKLSDIAGDPAVRDRYPVLAQAAHAVATPQIRNIATLGGNLCQNTRCWYYRYPQGLGGTISCLRKGSGSCLAVKGDNRYHAIMGKRRCFAPCPSDLAVALAALDATIAVAGPAGTRTVPVQDFYTSMGPALQPDELVTEVRIPKVPERAKQAFVKYTVRQSIDFAVVSVASVILCEKGLIADIRVALGGVAPAPVRATAAEELLRGKPINEAIAAEAAQAAVADARPLSMNAYKIKIAKTLVKRALLA